MEREGRRIQRLSPALPCPAQAGMDSIFEIKIQLAHTQTCGVSLPLDEGGEG